MKNKNIFALRRVLLFVALSSVFTACKKEDGPNAEAEASMVEASNSVMVHETAMQPVSESYGIVMSQFVELAAEIGRMQNGRPSGLQSVAGEQCYTTTVTPKNIFQWPKTVVRDFGDKCKGDDQKTRSGKIVSVFDSPYWETDARVTTTFQDYVVDSFKVTGVITFVNQFRYTPDTAYVMDVEVSNVTATHVRTGYWTKLNGDLTYQLEKTTPNYFSPLTPFTTAGNLTGVNSLGFNWTLATEKPVLRKHDCPWPMAGIISLQWNANIEKAFIDYGDGKCDQKAELRYKGFKKTINL